MVKASRFARLAGALDSPVLWDHEHVKALLRFPTPMQDQEPWQHWIEQHGGLEAVYAFLLRQPLAPIQQKLLQLRLDQPSAPAKFYAAQLGLSPSAYFIHLKGLCETLAQALNAWPHPATPVGPIVEIHASVLSLGLPSLPAETTSFFGREQELAAVERLLAQPAIRLVTLTGAGGTGKTRLALRAALRLSRAYAGQVAFVSLAPIRDAELVAPTIAYTLGIREFERRAPVEGLKAALRAQRLLLVLDNFEQVAPAAPLLAELLAAAPLLDILVTSRARLHLSMEYELVVPPLTWPDSTARLPLADAAANPAVALFAARAQAINANFVLTAENVGEVVAVCARVDGLPLAIELAAGRSKALAPAALRARLTSRLAFLTLGARDLPARQQTLRNTIAWSYELLEAAEKELFARLAVFVGGWTGAAAQALWEALGGQAIDLQEGLPSLVDKSLVQAEEGGEGETRYRMLETIREYALERLIERGEEQGVRGQYAAYYLTLVETANQYLTGEEQELWLGRLEAEHDNFRAALDWYTQRGEADVALRLIAVVWKFWHIRSGHIEGRRWIALVLAMEGPHNAQVRAQVLYGAGWIALDQSDYIESNRFFDQSLALFRSLQDTHGVAKALHGVGMTLEAQGSYADAATLFNESLALYQELQDDEGIAWSFDHLGNASLCLHDYEHAQALFEKSLAIFQTLKHSWGLAISLHHQGLAALAQHEHRRALEVFKKSLALFEELGNSWGMATSFDHLGYTAFSSGDLRQAEAYFTKSFMVCHAAEDRDGLARSLAGLGWVALYQGDYAQARDYLMQSLRLSWEIVMRDCVAECLEGLACVAAAELQAAQAGRLWGAAAALREAIEADLPPIDIRSYERLLAALRHELDQAVVAQAWNEGRAMRLDQAITYALQDECR